MPHIRIPKQAPICTSNPAAKKFRIFCHILPNMCYNSTGILAWAVGIPRPGQSGKEKNNNPMGIKKPWYIQCAAPALAVLMLAGCGATVDLNESMATAETAMTVQWVPNGSMYAAATEELEFLSAAQKLEATLAATPETAPSTNLYDLLDEFCAAQPGSFSVYLQNPATGESYTYNTDALYYPASLLKLPYAFWLCGQADAGTLDLEDELPNQFRGRLADTALQAYNDAETIPAKAAMRAMIAHSDNNAVTLLTTHWPANEASGFQQFLADYGFAYAATCALTPQTGIVGMVSVGEFANIVSAVYNYLDSDSAAAAYLKTCMLAADHDILYVPDGVPAAKKYGSWDYAYHDAAIVYAKHPYWIVCMTDQGNEEIDFPEEPTQAMQTLGQLVYEYWNP